MTETPVIAKGFVRFSRAIAVGTMSDSSPPKRSEAPSMVTTSGTSLVV